MALWRGFQTYAVDLATKVRSCLGVSLHEQLDARQLAAAYGLSIVSFDQLSSVSEAVRYFTETHTRQLSGFVAQVDSQGATAVSVGRVS